MDGLPNYDAWLTDPDYGRSARDLQDAQRRADLDTSWQCAHKLCHHCRPKVQYKHYFRDDQGQMRFEWRTRYEAGDAMNCGCDCHEQDYCHTCHSYQCHCDELYEARYGR